MNLIVTKGQEKITLSTDILWHLSGTNFDTALTQAVKGLKFQGWKIEESIENYEAWEYIFCNLDEGVELVK